MPPTDKVIKVLITGFGSFRNFDENPSWLAVRNLHNIWLDLQNEPDYTPDKESSDVTEAPIEVASRRLARVQCVHIPVHYGTILDTIPRLHGSKEPYSPYAKRWFDDRCDQTGLAGEDGKSYPDGYRIEHPEDGFDVIIHVGVGRTGGIRVETLGHKIGYKHGDTKEDLAPEVPLAVPTNSSHGAADGDETVDGVNQGQIEYDASVANEELIKDGKLRGLGEGYETFGLEERTDADVPAIVEWLKQKGMGDGICQSKDAGRYLCDFIFYCSLCEAKRWVQQGKKAATVLFIHVPPVGQDLTTEACTAAIRCIAWHLSNTQGIRA